MSFFSGSSARIPSPNPKPMGLDARKLPTNQFGIPVPLVYGRERISVFYLNEAFNPKADPVIQEVGKEEIISGYNYYCSFAAGVCHGPVDVLEAVYFDGIKVWPPEGGEPLLRDVSNPVSAPVTIEGWGTWTWYWGTESQGIDATLGAMAPGKLHSGYVGLCYFVAVDHLLGYNRDTVQRIEVVVGRYLDTHFGSQGEVSAWLLGRKIGAELNPMAAVVDALVNSRYGLSVRDVGSSDTWLDRDVIQAAATVLGTEGLGVSNSITREQTFDQFLVTLLETVDAYHYASASGRIAVALNRPPPADEALPVIDEVDIVGEPSMNNPTWLAAYTGVAIKYVNGENQFTEDVANGPNASARVRVGEPNQLSVERPWIRNPNTAIKLAHVMAKVSGRVPVTGTIRVRQSRLQGIGVGDRFLLHWAHWSLCNLQCVCTALATPDPFAPSVDIEWEVDRAALSRASYAAATYVPPERSILPAPAVQHFRPIEMPYSPHYKDSTRIAFLIQRPSRTAVGWQVRWQQPGGGYRVVKQGTGFALHGTLAADYSSTASGQIQLAITGPDLPADLPAVSAADAAANAWILLIAKSDGRDEMMAVHTKVDGPSSTVYYSVLRERFDTAKRAHSAGDHWYLFPITFASQTWMVEGSQADGTVHTFKPQSKVLGTMSDIDEATPVSVTIGERSKRPWKPKAVTCSSTWKDSTTITLSWTPQDKELNNGKSPVGVGTWWRVEFRNASADPSSEPGAFYDVTYEQTGFSVVGSDIEAAVAIDPVDLRVTVLAVSGSYRSLHSDEFIVTRV